MEMKKLIHCVGVVAHVVALPVTKPIDLVFHNHPQHKKRAVHIVIGAGLMFTGSYLAHNVPTWASHTLWDTTAYGLHGFGAAPIVKLVAELFKIEV